MIFAVPPIVKKSAPATTKVPLYAPTKKQQKSTETDIRARQAPSSIVVTKASPRSTPTYEVAVPAATTATKATKTPTAKSALYVSNAVPSSSTGATATAAKGKAESATKSFWLPQKEPETATATTTVKQPTASTIEISKARGQFKFPAPRSPAAQRMRDFVMIGKKAPRADITLPTAPEVTLDPGAGSGGGGGGGGPASDGGGGGASGAAEAPAPWWESKTVKVAGVVLAAIVLIKVLK